MTLLESGSADRGRIPRRTLRFPDEVWEAGKTKAKSEGKNLTEVLRRLLDGYLVGHPQGLDDYRYEYRAVPKDPSLSTNQRVELTVDGITGDYDDVRRLYPAKHWTLHERTVSPYKPAARRTTRP